MDCWVVRSAPGFPRRGTTKVARAARDFRLSGRLSGDEVGLRTGVSGVVCFFEAFGGEMRINLSRDQVRVAQELLDAA